MDRDTVIRLAREAGLIRTGDGWTEPHRWGMDEIERFAALVAAAEREECAKVCDGWTHADGDQCAAAIRSKNA